MFKTLKSKLSLVYIGLVTLMAVVAVFSVTRLVSLQNSVDGLMTDNYKSISAAQGMTDALEKQDNAIVAYISFDNEKGIDGFYKYEAVFTEFYNTASRNVTENGEQSIINAIGKNCRGIEEYFSKMQLISDKSGKPAAESYYEKTMLPVFNDTRSRLSGLIALNQTAMFKSKDKVAADVRLSIYTLILLSLLAVAGGLSLSRFFVGRLTDPLGVLTEGLSRVKEGDLGLTLDIKSDDELGKLAHEFNGMTKRLSAYEKSTLGTLMSERNKVVAIVKSISDPIVVLDVNYRIILLNSACEKFFGIEEEKVRSRHFLEAIRNGTLFDLVSKSVEEKKPRTENVVQLERGGKTYYFGAAVTTIMGPQSGASGYILLLRNVTRLKELDRLRADFFAAVSHELKTPLTSIIMGASMLRETELGPLNDEQNDIVKAISDDGEKLSNFVSELLQISKIESENAVYTFSPCSILAVAENSCKSFAAMAQRDGITLRNNVPSSLPFVRADFEKITWVLNNLLSNALKYTDTGDTVSVDAAKDGDSITVCVSDTGTGIPEEYHDRIFDKFVQVPNPELEIRGSGIGLSVAKEIIAAHGGTIGVKSEPGRGSTFHFTLPVFNDFIKKRE